MIRINLLPVREIKAESGRRKDLLVGVVSLAAALLVCLGLFLFQFYRVSSLEHEVAAVRKEIEALNAQTKAVVDLERKIAELKEKQKAIDLLSVKKTVPVQVMENLSATVSPRLWLTEFKESEGSLTISGQAVDNQAIADFLQALSKSPYFKDVDLVEAVQVEQDGIAVKKFTMKSTLSYALPTPAKKQG